MATTQLADPTDYGNKPGDGPLRQGGTQGKVLRKIDLPETRTEQADVQLPAVEMCRDLYRGTEQVRARGQKYLPRAPGETLKNYDTRLDRSVFHNFFRRTVEGLVGLIFRKDPVLGEDVPPQIQEHWENLDMNGTHGDVFLRELETDAMTAGHAAILVDYPQTDGSQTRADEIAGGIRPYWVPVCKDDIFSWRTAHVGGSIVLTQIVIRERQWVPKGEYGAELETRYRVLYLDEMGNVKWRLEEVTKDKTIEVVAEGAYPTQDEIPIAEIPTSGSRSMFESDPPLLDVAHLNVAHYQTFSDYVYAIHMTNVPLLVTSGLSPLDNDGNPTKITTGPNTVIMIPDPQGKAEYVSHNGAALESTRNALDGLKSDIGSLGLAMLAPQKRSAETAEAKRLDKSTSDSALSVSARALQDGVERALGFHARYLRLDSGGSIQINRDFEGLVMEPAVMSAYAQLGREIGLPPDLILRELQAGGRIAEDVDIEEVELMMMANAAANAALQAESDADEESVEDEA